MRKLHLRLILGSGLLSGVLAACVLVGDNTSSKGSSATSGCTGDDRFSGSNVECGSAPAVLGISHEGNSSGKFGTVYTTYYPVMTLTVTNAGQTQATKLSGSSLSSPFSWYGGKYPGNDGTCGDTLSAGASCIIKVSYSPVDGVTSTGGVTLTYDDGTRTQTVTFTISGVGTVSPTPTTTSTSTSTSTSSSSSSSSSSCTSTSVYASQTSANGSTVPLEWTTDGYGYAQSFQFSAAQKISAVVLKGGRTTTNDTFTNISMEIQSDSSSKPSGTAVTSTTSSTTVNFDYATAPSDITFTWSTPYQLSASTTYWMVIKVTRNAASSYLKLRHYTTSNYASGNIAYTLDGGSSWTANTNQDLYFQIYTCDN